MGVASWLRGESILRRAQTFTLSDPGDAGFDSLAATRTKAGESISTTTAMAIADVFAAVNIITGQVSLCPLKTYRDLSLTPTNPRDTTELAPEHRMYRLLRYSPNPFTPAHRFWATVAAHELLWGNWFLELLRDETGTVNELRLCDPSTTMVYWNELTGAKGFRVRRQDGSEVMLGEDRVLHGFGVSLNGLVGLSTIAQCREALGVTKARTTFEAEVYGERPMLSGWIGAEKSLSKRAVQNIRASWRAIYGGPGSERQQVAVLEEGARYNLVTMPFADMQFVEQAQLSKTEIAIMFKLPPSYLGGSTGDSLTYATVEGNKIQLVDQAVAPLTENIAAFVSRDSGLFPFPSWFCRFDLAGLMRGDSGARADYFVKLFGLQDNDGKRAISIDEIREAEGRGPAEAEKPKQIPAPLIDPTVDPSSAAAMMANGNG